MDIQRTLQELWTEKRWFDAVIGSLERLEQSKPYRAAALLELLADHSGGLRLGAGINSRNRDRLSRWLNGA